jgi:hypothetical protein
MSDESNNQQAVSETAQETKRRHDRDRKRLQRGKERTSKAQAAAELAAKLASEQARVDADAKAKERFEFLKIELEPPRLPGAQGLTDTTVEEWNALVEDEIDMYLASLSCANDFKRLFKYLSVVLPSLLVHRGVTPLSHDELADIEWADKDFNDSRPSAHEPPSPFEALVVSSPGGDKVDHELLEHIMFKANLVIQGQKGEQQEIEKAHRHRVRDAERIWKTGNVPPPPTLQETPLPLLERALRNRRDASWSE